jgi:hypothetical protein
LGTDGRPGRGDRVGVVSAACTGAGCAHGTAGCSYDGSITEFACTAQRDFCCGAALRELSDDRQQEFFSDGMTDEITSATGNTAFSNRFYIIQPTMAFGKGWGNFDVQATVSEQFPTGGVRNAEKSFGHPVLVNVTAQYFLLNFFSPELEANSIRWPNGSKEGKTQLFLTPGIIFGRFTIRDRVKLIFGAGYQFSVSPAAPAYRNNVILTLRHVLGSEIQDKPSYWESVVGDEEPKSPTDGKMSCG